MNHALREKRTAEWFAKARFGIFYHWGRFTGGGVASENPEQSQPLKYPTVEAFDKATPDPERIARNMAEVAGYLGAKYVIFTSNHSCDGYTMLYPSKCEGYLNRTPKDYIMPLSKECHKRGMKLLLYTQHDPSHSNGYHDGPALAPEYTTTEGFAKLFEASIVEMMERYGEGIDGFWIDGQLPEQVRHVPTVIHEKNPHYIVVVNNETEFRSDDVDYATTEFLREKNISPAYCRPLGLWQEDKDWGIQPPLSDYNEDIPTCNGWWDHGQKLSAENNPYVAEPNYIVKQMVSSLGQRKKWNYVLGLGLDIAGSIPLELVPMVESCHNFTEWAAESIYDTVGGEDSYMLPGEWGDGAFGSVTRKIENDKMYYLHITTAPAHGTVNVPLHCPESAKIQQIVNLRTGESVPFLQTETTVSITADWKDTELYGDTVLKVLW